ncbi:3-keto-5-aminohexanoate cleavage protein [Oricola sp.]|uniref:3-keto-5-aminohexanoate cleavage protein n=1 Tax=Oricola sp. TaxID=1979950 RepID=UPI0025E429FE|nr:3-keto-5-aminohexanoate cleavage protein [Oricola sp.]MCI5074898.1 3-keto-5-aminohexanoate cleavage protein [Oricola sp.]
MNSVFLTCAITGNFTTRAQNPNLPITPEEIATACLDAARAGATIVHIHVRDPETEAPSMDVDLYRQVVERIRNENRTLIINLTCGPGGRYHPSEADPAVAGPRTNLVRPERRVEHVVALRPDIATLDLNTMVFGNEVVINTLDSIRVMAAAMYDAGVRPELELFDSGDIAIFNQLVREGTIQPDPLCSIVMGVNYGFVPSPETLLYARDQLPAGSAWTGFATSRWAFPMVAQAVVAGGHARIGMEDAVYLSRGQLAPDNAAMVAKARRIIEDVGFKVASCEEARERLGLRSSN